MWSETVGLRTRPVWDQKIGLGLGPSCTLLSWSWSCTLWSWSWSWSCRSGVVLWNTILSRPSSYWSWRTQQLFKYYLWFLYSVLGTSLLWRSTVVFTYLKVKSTKCLSLLPVVLVLLFWSWSWSCKQQSWSWSCYFGLSLKNLVLFGSLLARVFEMWHTDRRTTETDSAVH